MKKILIYFTLIIINTNLYAGFTDTLSIGIGGGYTNYNTLKGEFYLKSELELINLKSEIKIGLNTHSYQLIFDNVSELNASSFGVFGDIAIYPFGKGFLTGIRWEAINFNWLSENSKNKIISERDYTPTDLFTGTSIFLQVGYIIKLSKNLCIKLYGQPGFQQYKISNGSFSSGDFVQGSTDNIIIENHFKFIFNGNLSIELKIK